MASSSSLTCGYPRCEIRARFVPAGQTGSHSHLPAFIHPPAVATCRLDGLALSPPGRRRSFTPSPPLCTDLQRVNCPQVNAEDYVDFLQKLFDKIATEYSTALPPIWRPEAEVAYGGYEQEDEADDLAAPQVCHCVVKGAHACVCETAGMRPLY